LQKEFYKEMMKYQKQLECLNRENTLLEASLENAECESILKSLHCENLLSASNNEIKRKPVDWIYGNIRQTDQDTNMIAHIETQLALQQAKHAVETDELMEILRSYYDQIKQLQLERDFTEMEKRNYEENLRKLDK